MTQFSLYSDSPDSWKIVWQEGEGIWYEAFDYPRFHHLKAARFVVDALNTYDRVHNPGGQGEDTV